MNIGKAALGTMCAVGTTAGLYTGKALAKAAKEGPQGACGSFAHIMSNPNIPKEDKINVLNEVATNGNKNTLKLGAAAVGVASGAALATGVSKKAQSVLGNLVSKAGEKLSKISVDGKSVKDMVKNSEIGKKFLNAPPALKAGILAGAAVLAVATPLVALCTAAKSGYTEAQHEVK